MNKRILIILFAALIILTTMSSVLALTGSIGNSRMVLRLEQGEEIEKYILVKNVNDIPLTIELIPTGDLADEVKLKEETFILFPGEQKKAYFTITASKPGTTETRINVKFTPAEGNGVGLTSTIIIIAPGENEPENPEQDIEQNVSNTNSPITGGVTADNVPEISRTTILVISTLILMIALLALIIYLVNKKKNRGRRSRA